MCSQLQTTSVNNFPSVYPHANRSHAAWKCASQSSLILTHTPPLIDSLFTLELQGDVRYSFAVRKGMSSLWCLAPVPVHVPVSAGAALACHFLHQTRPLDWNSAVTRCSSAVWKHKHEKARRREAISIQSSRISGVDYDETGGGVRVSETLALPAYRTFAKPDFFFFFFFHRRVRNARRAAFHWQCQQGNMNNAKKKKKTPLF